METPDLIDTVLNYTYNVSAADTDNAGRRARVLQFAQETHDEIWFYREWAFSFSEEQVTVDTNGYGTLPADFLELGVQGGVYTNLGDKLIEVTFPEIVSRSLQSQKQNPPELFAIFAEAEDNLLRTPPVGSSVIVNVHYRRFPADLEDTALTSPELPGRWHNTVLIPGIAAKVAHGLGDIRTDFREAYVRGLNRMITIERSRKTSIQRMPRALSKW